jgi:MoxR-like ATPase
MSTQPKTLPGEAPAGRRKQDDPSGYIVDPELENAVGVALLLGQPLLLTGEPGTGKTQLAHWLARSQKLGDPLVFNTKSTSTARDLFYTFDAMRRFHAAHTGAADESALNYITYNAFGLAILHSHPREAVADVLPPQFQHTGPRRSVVLVDEIDKAPRDFPNDLLNEVVSMSFRIPELGNPEIAAEDSLRPILVLTSNSEKNLPDAFLRRCVFYNIPFPGRERLIRIVQTRLGGFEDARSPFLNSAIDFFMAVRASNVRKPSTAELLDFTRALEKNRKGGDAAVTAQEVAPAIGTLAKTLSDTDEVRRVLKAKLGEP